MDERLRQRSLSDAQNFVCSRLLEDSFFWQEVGILTQGNCAM